MAIQVALLGHVKVRGPWLGIENPKGLLESAHWFLIAVAATASSNQRRTRRFQTPSFLPMTRTTKMERGTWIAAVTAAHQAMILKAWTGV